MHHSHLDPWLSKNIMENKGLKSAFKFCVVFLKFYVGSKKNARSTIMYVFHG